MRAGGNLATERLEGFGVSRRRRCGRCCPTLVGMLLFVAYFALPFTSGLTTHTVLLLSGGLLGVGALLAWQVQAIRMDPMPLARGVGTLTLSVPLFLIVFSVTYFLMGRENPSAWSEPLNRLDALYFTITTFATVGYGDITAASQTARAVVTVQMVGDLLVVGVIARVVVQAVREGLARREPPSRTGAPETSSDVNPGSSPSERRTPPL